MKRPPRHMIMYGLAGMLMVFLVGSGQVPSSEPDAQPKVVARAGSIEVTAEEFRARYVDYLLSTGLRDQPALRKVFLHNVIASRLLIKETRDDGIEQEASYRWKRGQVRRKLLLEAYAHRVLFDTLRIGEAEVEAMFVRAHTQLKARHLFARTREEAYVLYARLQAGEAFEALAKEVFADPKLAENGGSVGYFSFDEMDPAFEDAAFALEVGEVSMPVQTAHGFSIIQLEDRFIKPLLTESEYAQQRKKLRQYVLYRKQQQARQQHVRRLADALNLRFEAAALDGLLARITGTGMLESEEDVRSRLAESLVAFGLPTQRVTWSVGDFRKRAQFTDEKQRARVRTREDLIEFIKGLVVREVMMERAVAQALDATPAFDRAMREAMDEVVLARARERLAAEVEVPEDSVRAYFEAAQTGEFVQPAQVRVWEILVATKAEAEQVKQQLALLSFEALARTHSVRPGARETGGDLGFLSHQELGPLAEAVFDASEGDLLGPLEIKGRYTLLRVGARRSQRPILYEEARPAIVEQLRYRYARAEVRRVYEEIQARYEISVDYNLLLSMPLTGG
ncbi:MAG: peptidylprolyl isomerase [Rhodothermales bacterium]